MYAVTKECKVVSYYESQREVFLAERDDIIYYGFYDKKDAQRWAWFRFRQDKEQ